MNTTAAIPADTQGSLERVLCYLKGEKPQRVACFPLILNHAARVLGVPVGVYNRDGKVMGKAHVAAFRRYGNDLILIFSTTSTLAEAMGTKMKFFDEDAPQIEEPFLKQHSDISKLKLPDFSKDGRLPVYMEATEICVKEVGSEVVVSTVFGGPLTTAAALYPVELLTRDMIKNPAWVHELLEICTQAGIKFIDEILKRGALPIIVEPIGSGSLVSPRHFKEFVAPYLKRLADHVHKTGGGMPAVLHICGKTTPNFKAMLEADFDIWSLDACDLGEAKKVAGHRVALVGNVIPANLLKNTPEEIDAEAREICEKMGDKVGFILGSGCEVPINTPPENIDALINAARKYGRYDS
ncbi:MAG: uroporphyrinogen decarboxylase family protein [Nitrosomonadales bacterium]|nr:uroporphyrinogen decarboxylase family protein [Nitrosomonadales bacterium]